jgi:hypothetical protein
MAAEPGTRQNLPWCKGDQRASTRPPVAPPSLTSPGACRARVSSLQRTRAIPAPGYHHLGATTTTGWSGVLARLEVGDPGVRAGTFDFLATRVMAKGETPDGLAWIEAGWAETGWDGAGKQRIYTYDTNRDAWAFYSQYEVKPGDRFWIFMQTEQDIPTPIWQAWLWWSDAWHLLTSQQLPLTGRAKIEQYVEVHTENPFPVPPVQVDNVQLKDGPTGAMTYWNEKIATAPGLPSPNYCLTWIHPYDTWRAGDCNSGAR